MCIYKLMVTLLNKLTGVRSSGAGGLRFTLTPQTPTAAFTGTEIAMDSECSMGSVTDLQEEGTLVLCLRTGGPEPLREVLRFGSRHEVSQSQRLLLQLFGGFPGEETFTLALQEREKAALRVCVNTAHSWNGDFVC